MELAHPKKGFADAEEPARGKRFALFQSPGRLLLLMAAAIFFCEILVMLVLDRIPHIPHSVEAIIDSTILIVILSPTFYVLWFRPFMHHIRERRRSEMEIRYLSRQLLDTAEEERKKLARDLHDEFGQAMTALQLDIENLQRVSPAADESHRAVMERIHQEVRLLNDRVRNFASGLRPEMLDDMGIVPALQWHLRDFLRQCGDLQAEFRAVGLKRRLPAEIEIALYRICQEALNNVVKHAGARNVAVWLTCSHPKIILTIRDDGTGFEVSRGGRKGIGLLGMRERAAAVGGRLRVVSGPGRGTMVRVELPAAAEEDHAQDSRSGR